MAAGERAARSELSQSWLTAVLFAIATALLSGAIGLLPGALDDERSRGWAHAWASWTWRLTIVFGVAGLAALACAAMRWRKNQKILSARGTAYVIDEQGALWLHEEKESVLADIGGGFAATLLVPGPRALGFDWDWRADEQHAPLWDTRVDQLVSSFWSVHHNDSKVTRNAVFVWAPWPVAMAFGARATARRRGLVLHVRQRPSYGAAGPHRRPLLTDRAHSFARNDGRPELDEVAPAHRLAPVHHSLKVTIRPLSGQDGGQPQRARGVPVRDRKAAPVAAPILLVVRVSHGPLGPIDEDLTKTEGFTLAVSPGLLGDDLPTGVQMIRAAEWRLEAREGGRISELPWDAFPAAAESIAEWVIEQARGNQTVLLATRMPQELAVGLGVQLGQRSSGRTGKPDQAGRTGDEDSNRWWPERVYPAAFERDRLVVPDLRLGAESLSRNRT